MKLLIALSAVFFIFNLSCINWRHSVQTVFFIVVIEGALRKWALPQASEFLYFLKDLILLGAYLRCFIFTKSKIKPFPNSYLFNIVVFSVVGWCIFQAFNSSLGSPIVGLFGLKGYIFYIPLVWMIPNLFQSESEFYQFLRTYLLLIIPVSILGIIQYFSPINSPINAYVPGGVESIAGFNGHVRITATFSYISGYAAYLIVNFSFLIPLIFTNQSKTWQFITISELLFIIVNSFMTGSRGVIFTEALLLIGYLFIRGFIEPNKTARLIKKFLVPTIIVSLIASIWFKPAIDNFMLRATSNSDVSGRITDSFVEPLKFVQYKQLDGYGTGATHPGGRAIRNILNLPAPETIPVYYEGEMGRILLELGPIGFLFWYGLRIIIIFNLWGVFWKLQRPLLRQLALCAFLIHVIQFSGQLVVHHTFLFYYWFLSSFIFLLPRLEQIENWYKEQQIMEQNVLYSYIFGSSHR